MNTCECNRPEDIGCYQFTKQLSVSYSLHDPKVVFMIPIQNIFRCLSLANGMTKREQGAKEERDGYQVIPIHYSGGGERRKDEGYLENRLISSSMAFSETLKTSEVSRKRRFSVGTNPSKKMLMPE